MGILTRSQSAVLATLLVVLTIGHVHASTRKYVNTPSNGSVINSGNGSSRSGDMLRVPGDPIDGEYIPSSYRPSKGTKLPVKPTYDYSIPRTLKGMSGKLRGGVAGAAIGIGLQYMLDAVDGVIKDGQVMVPQSQTFDPVGPNDYYWIHATVPAQTKGSTATQSCQLFVQYANNTYTPSNGRTYTFKSLTYVSDTRFSCVITGTSSSGSTTDLTGNVNRQGTTCPDGSTYSSADGACVGTGDGYRPATDADFDLMEAAANAKDSEWLKDRLREHCEGGLSPESCYESLRDSVSLSGPSSITEPGPTTTVTSPAGTSTSTQSSTVNIRYGNNYYDYTVNKTTITTNPDGSTETKTETEPETPVEETPEEQEEEIDFTDSEFPPVEPFYVQKYPDGLSGVWQSSKQRFDESAFISFLGSFVPQFQGSCPAWSMSFNISAWANYGNIPFVNLCNIFEFIKVILMVTALFTARAITFGG